MSEIMSEWYYVIPMVLGFGIYESLWRRWFGGGLDSGWLKIFDHRFLKHIVNIGALFCVCYYIREMNIWWSIYSSLVFQILFWTTSFGMYFDIGRSGKPITEYDIEEYNKTWFAFILNWLFYKDEYRYTAFYDYVGMFIRFTSPLLLLFWVPSFNSGLIFLGSIVSMAYGIGWVMRDRGIIEKIGPTEFGEYISGFFAGIYWMISL